MLLGAQVCPARHCGENLLQAVWAEFGGVGWRMALDAAIQEQGTALGERSGIGMFPSAGANKGSGDQGSIRGGRFAAGE